MSRLKKIAIIVSMFLIGIMGMATASRAENSFTGDTVTVRDGEYYKNQHMFCLEPDADPPYGTYKRVAYIEIEGKEATANGKTWTSTENAKLAYMLYNAKKESHSDYIDTASTLRATGWVYFPWWWGKAKTNLEITDNINVVKLSENDSKISDALSEYRKLRANAQDYCYNYKGSEITKLNSDVKLSTESVDGTQYYKIGPFKCKFSNKLDSISVTTNKGNVTPNMYLQRNERFSNVGDLVSARPFYIYIKANSETTEIREVKINGEEVTTYGAQIYIYKTVDYPSDQNFAYFIPSMKKQKPSITYSLGIKAEGNLQILKIDKYRETKLSGIGFKVYSQEGKGWLKINASGQLTGYTTFDDADVIYTKEGTGRTIWITNLPFGKYDIYETDVGKYSYRYALSEIDVPKKGEGTEKKIAKLIKKGFEVSSNSGVAICTAENEQDLGRLRIKKVDGQTQEPLAGIGFKIYSHSEKGWLKLDGSMNVIGYTDFDNATEIYTKINSKLNGETNRINQLPLGNYGIYETNLGKHSDLYVLKEISVPKQGGGTEIKVAKEIQKSFEVSWTEDDKPVVCTAVNIKELGELTIKKIDKDTGEPLSGIGFKIYSKSKQGWLKLDSKNNVKEYTTFDNATELFTNKKGMTDTVKKVIIGKYDIYETNLGSYSDIYSLGEITVPTQDGKEEKRVAKLMKEDYEVTTKTGDEAVFTAENKQEYINLSGYVWVDRISEKQSVRNDLFKDNDYDSSDILLDGIKVRLKAKTLDDVAKEETIAETETANGGAYIFKKVKIDRLSDYYVEFEYSGLTYTNVVPHTDKNNGSKAIEGENTRTAFNNKFAEITKDTTIDKIALEYNTNNHTSTLTNAAEFIITSSTKETPFDISGQYKPGMKEIKYINLGLYEREQPDLALVKDIENVKIAVNGYEHIYQYATRFVNAGEYSGGFNVGVKFGEKYGTQTYSRAIYKSDYDYRNESDTSKELKAYITYKIAVENQSTNLTSKVNSIVDYYDARYTFVAAGTDINGKTGNIAGNAVSATNNSYNSKYNKLVLTTDMTIEHQSQSYIYVQFSLNREAIGSIMFDARGEEVKDKILLDNVAEINSYTTYQDGKIYAGVDKDSRPGNAVPGDVNTYEDDTDAAPALSTTLADARKITGSVFLDGTSAELRTGEERLGDGIFNDGETTIPGVTVKMIKDDGTVVSTTTTDENGYFEISGFLPGNYTLVYTWGNETYTVNDYKGTIFNDLERFGRNNWYAENMEIRYSDAIDNYDTRKLIDSGEHPEITTMDSSTPTMKFGIEMYDQNATRVVDITSGIDKVEFLIKNLDFGIVERPRQQLDISKNATAVKITLANGQVIVDAKIENGELKGEATKGVKYGPPSATSYGFINSEIDNELIQGATIQIEYTITVANNSEVDYDSETYYKYGKVDGNKITIKPSGVYDYLDSEMVLDSSKETENTGWEIKNKEEYTTEVIESTEPTIVDKYLIEYASTTTDPEGFIKNIQGYKSFFEEYSEEISEFTKISLANMRKTVLADKTVLRNANLERELQPGESNTVNLYTSKVLSNTDEIDLNNSTEITKVERNSQTGRKVTPRTSRLYDNGERVTVTPPTGENQEYVLPIILGVSTLIILGAGVVLIKKKVIK